MFLKSQSINGASFVSDIVTNDYRTAEIFRKYGIEYCCGGKWPLEMICDTKNIDLILLIKELEEATRTVHVPNSLPFNEWGIDFLADYIVHVHHHYLKNQLPEIKSTLLKFAEEHREKFSYLQELEITFLQLYNEMLPHIRMEEETIFPYIRQLTHAFQSRESYASLLVKTMRKPIEELMNHEHMLVAGSIHKMRELTNDYKAPARACTNHKVTFSRLRELDNDLAQHLHLENNILFPRAIEMEKILLSKTV
jgi:regulator of cell morphogenesis and NO signaling